MLDANNIAEQNQRRTGSLALSVVWGYAFAGVLLAFLFLILIPDSDGPSPWDPEAFRKGLLEIFANFRILDDMADLRIVKVADIGDGLIVADLDLLQVSSRKFGWAPFYLAVAGLTGALFLRASRLRLLAAHAGIPPTVRGQLTAFFFGRGVNLWFPFGAGELATTEALVEGGADPETAVTAVFHNRVHEILAINTILLLGFFYLGWEGGAGALFWSIVLLAAVVSLTRPMGTPQARAFGIGPVRNIWAAFNGPALLDASRVILQTPRFAFSLWLLSCAALGLEILAYWCIKQAFSSPMDDYVLMKNLPFIHFAIAVTVAALTRIIPYTFASLGVYELSSTLMFRVFGQGYLTGATVSLLDSMLLNSVTLLLFVAVLFARGCPSVLETWRKFFEQSVRRNQDLAAASSAEL
ncbi:MAG TPA: lysylphosphatidylglycerol synthase transmembrane domain-containing protein [Bryobacteraceae bacterium]|nr:lysylphosphatidylglycerol synthase transmembrane domain-containing protein [Bryobacteraceae bacterium]